MGLIRASVLAALLAFGLRLYSSYRSDVNPSIQINQGLVQGKIVPVPAFPDAAIPNAIFEQEHYLGVPFASPPLGDLRFAPPQSVPDDPKRIIDAKEYGKACIQPVIAPQLYNLTREEMSEDCLTLDIIRPRGVTSSKKLPVMVWIYGGAFNLGASRSFDGTEIVGQSVAINKPVIYVALNYRVNLFGFLASDEIQKASKERTDVVLNAGLHDQRLALQWIQKNIDAFGGDKDQVTVFGESAGAMSIGAHLLAEYWEPRRLFRAAILQSGAPSGYPILSPSKFNQQYTNLAKGVGCGPTASASGEDSGINTLLCLRGVDTDVLLNATYSAFRDWPLDSLAIGQVPFGIVQDDVYFHGRPSVSLKAGQIATVPIITGNNLDEGTYFAATNVASGQELPDYIQKVRIYESSPDVSENLDEITRLYPDNASIGSPYINEASKVDLDPEERFFEPKKTNQFKRLSSLTGDLLFESGRRAHLDAYLANTASSLTSENADSNARDTPIWSYHLRQPVESAEWPKYLGISHGADIALVYGAGARLNGTDTAEVSRMMMRAWIQFAHNLDPNGPELPTWPRYTSSGREILQIHADNTTVVKDDYRREAIEFLAQNEEWNFLTSR